MSTLVSFVDEVEQEIAGDVERRVRSLRKLTELFAEYALTLNEAQVSVFDEVLERLARDADVSDRIELAQRLSGIGKAPAKILKDLACDGHAAVAEPVLERAMLADNDLLEVVQTQNQDHLLAISRRTALSERLTDALIDRGDHRVVRAVAENEGAKLSQPALTSLVEKAGADSDLKALLQKRSDLPSGFPQPTEAPRPRPAAKREIPPHLKRMEEALAEFAKALADGSEPRIGDLSPALDRIRKLASQKSLTEATVVVWIKNECVGDALAAIAHGANLPPSMVARSYEAAGYEPLLLVVRAARFNWNTFKLLLTSSRGQVPPANLLKQSFEVYQQISVGQAQGLARLIAAQGAASGPATA